MSERVINDAINLLDEALNALDRQHYATLRNHINNSKKALSGLVDKRKETLTESNAAHNNAFLLEVAVPGNTWDSKGLF